MHRRERTRANVCKFFRRKQACYCLRLLLRAFHQIPYTTFVERLMTARRWFLFIYKCVRLDRTEKHIMRDDAASPATASRLGVQIFPAATPRRRTHRSPFFRQPKGPNAPRFPTHLMCLFFSPPYPVYLFVAFQFHLILKLPSWGRCHACLQYRWLGRLLAVLPTPRSCSFLSLAAS